MTLDEPSLLHQSSQDAATSTKPIQLRQHIRGFEGLPITILDLSLDEDQITYGVIIDPLKNQLAIAKAYSGPDAWVHIHTHNSSVCVEAMRSDVSVQSVPSSFDGKTSNGILSLRASKDSGRILYQVYPGQSIFIGSHTISIVPQQDRSASNSASPFQPCAREDVTKGRLGDSNRDPLALEAPEAARTAADLVLAAGPTGEEDTHLDVLDSAMVEQQALNADNKDSPAKGPQEDLRSKLITQRPILPHESAVGKSRVIDHLRSTYAANSTDSEADMFDNDDIKPTTSPHFLMSGNKSLVYSRPDCVNVLFTSSTSVDSSKHIMQWLESHGVKQVRDVGECNVLCVSSLTPLRKTSKLIMAVLQGKDIITDTWVTESVDAGRLLDFKFFKANDPIREAEWGINLDQAIERGKKGDLKVFDGWTIAFTSAAKQEAGSTTFNELREIALHAGAKRCSGLLPKKLPQDSTLTLVITCRNDPALAKLNGDWRSFSREIIGLSSLRGQLDIESEEFLLKREDEVPRPKGTGKRKS